MLMDQTFLLSNASIYWQLLNGEIDRSRKSSGKSEIILVAVANRTIR